jgi:hypothetical protein
MKEARMNRTIALVMIVGLVGLVHGHASAAPTPSQVLVTNTTTSPVPTAVQPAATRTVFTGSFTSFNESTVDVSTCSEIRVTSSVIKGGEGIVSLFDTLDSGVTFPPEVLHHSLGPNAPAELPYASDVLDTPGISLTLDVTPFPGSTVSVKIYCR